MDNNDWRAGFGEPALDTDAWRAQMPADSRNMLVNKIMETFKRHFPFSGQEGLRQLREIAINFEEKNFLAAKSLSDYLGKLSLYMLILETKLPSDSAGSLGILYQVLNQGKSFPFPLPADQPEEWEKLSQNIEDNIGQNFNIQSMTGISQNSAMDQMEQGLPSSIAADSQWPMHTTPNLPYQLLPEQEQMRIQQQLEKELYFLEQKQQQQNLAPPTKLPWSEQSGMQTISVMEPSNVQSARLPDLQQQQLMQIVRKYSNDMSEKTDEHSVFVLEHQLKNPLQQELLIKKSSAVPEASSNMMPHLLGYLFLFLLFLWLYACYA